ncbi:MAG: ADP-glyceromanno-heptose 6-epimerase [Pelagibacterales bacterium]|nr:ADP-glyceromanno-heptose 6-epimerase [Pelagibacterales bacterium]
MSKLFKKIIITGGAGFIGSNLVRKFNEKGMTDILIVDNVKDNKEKKKNLERLDFVQIISKEYFMNDLNNYKEISHIFHQGACSDTMNHDVEFMMNNNFEYSKKILFHSLNYNINFIFASSGSVYGKGSDGFKEKSECEKPLNIYAKSKLEVDLLIRDVLTQDISSQVLSLRYFNVYGYPEIHKGRMASVPLHFFNQLKYKGKIKIFEGSENFKRDFIYIEDVLNIIDYFYENKYSGIYNAGTGEVNSFQKMAVLTKKMYPEIQIEVIPFPNNLKKHYQKFTQADTSQLFSTGFSEPFTTFEKGIENYYYLLEEDYYKS